LENIYPESPMPLEYYHLGEIRHKLTGTNQIQKNMNNVIKRKARKSFFVCRQMHRHNGKENRIERWTLPLPQNGRKPGKDLVAAFKVKCAHQKHYLTGQSINHPIFPRRYGPTPRSSKSCRMTTAWTRLTSKVKPTEFSS
jgi:hypothetical protein